MKLSNLHINAHGLITETAIRSSVLLEVQIELHRISDLRARESALMVLDLMVRNENVDERNT